MAQAGSALVGQAKGRPNDHDETAMTDDERRPRDSWKRKMGVEFSGLERSRDFLVAFLFFAVFVIIAMVIAFIAFG